ncbi:MAG: recombinase RecB [Cyanobacteria bacterium P01_H01_bin.152]
MTQELGNVSLRKVANGWEFASELALENVVWEHLEDLLQLQPFQRQYAVRGEVCDLLALNSDRQLSILELKNTEDRYIIQQLTRYYANLIEEKPFPNSIDYEKPIRLIAIAPTFHRHNQIDRQYSRLAFEFIEAKVTQTNQFYLELHREDSAMPLIKAELPVQEIELDPQPADSPKIPKQLLEWLGACSAQDQHAILKVRQQMLSFHPRMRELVTKRSIQYGTGKTKLCAEICFLRAQQHPVVFLWLPLPTGHANSNRAERTGRLRLWLHNGCVTHVGHVPSGFGKMRLPAEWEALPKSQWSRKYLIENFSHRSMTPVAIKGYNQSVLGTASQQMTLSEAVALALSKWLGKLGN